MGLRLGSAAPTEITTALIHRDAWTTPQRSIDDETVTIVGVLEKVDLHTHEFRVRDAVGNALELVDVPRDLEVAQFVGQQVSAEGRARRRRGGVLSGVHAPTVKPYVSPLSQRGGSTVETTLSGQVPSGSRAGLELSDDDFASFMRAIGRGE